MKKTGGPKESIGGRGEMKYLIDVHEGGRYKLRMDDHGHVLIKNFGCSSFMTRSPEWKGPELNCER